MLFRSGTTEETMYVKGTDGQKMSKSRDNYLTIFLPEKALRKQVMSIITDSKELEEPKDPTTCNVFALYELLANSDQLEEMRKNYFQGNYGYGHAKQALFELILDTYANERAEYERLMANKSEIDEALRIGAEKARETASGVLRRVREKCGY